MDREAVAAALRTAIFDALEDNAAIETVAAALEVVTEEVQGCITWQVNFTAG